MSIKSPRGTQDILPESWPLWSHVLEAARQTAELSGYERIETPMFELTSLFTHATGEHTDVNREMYTFQDRGGDDLSLRPEGTASAFRAYFQHGMHVRPQPVKLYYIGSMFRYERPQSGRFREHHQFGCEAIGSEDALLDASMVDLQARFYCRSGVTPLEIQVNSIGDTTCRPPYIRELVAYLRRHEGELCRQCRDRIERNPLRVLDCKVESCQPVLNAAPTILDHLCEECRRHWEHFLAGLQALGINVSINPRLVRGLDYYTRSVWEFAPAEAVGATASVGGGGRYDALAESIGEKATPGVGFSTGLERVLANLRPDVITQARSITIDVFVAHMGEQTALEALKLVEGLHSHNMSAEMSFGGRTLKTQLRHANLRGAKYAVILGEDEMALQQATVRNLQSGEQTRVALNEVVGFIQGNMLF